MTMEPNGGVVSLEEHQRLAYDYRRLEEKYKALSARHAQCKPYIDRATEKYEAAKHTITKWVAWLDRKGYYKQRGKPHIDPGELESSSTKEQNERHVTSSQTTEGETECTSHCVREQGSNDEPEVVSARSLKRKRGTSPEMMPHPVHIKVEHFSQDDPIELGSEGCSSPLKRQNHIRTQTSDLDAYVEHADTPRKRRNWRARSEEAAKPRALLPATSSLSEGDVPEKYNDGAYIKIETADTPQEAPITTICDSGVQTRNNPPGNILRQRSVNLPSVSNTDPYRRSKHKPGDEFLSEEGDNPDSQFWGQKEPPKTVAHINLRLNALLDEPSSSRQQLTKRATPESKLSRRPEKVTPQTEQPRSSVKNGPKSAAAIFKRPRGLEKSPTPPKLEEEPLRSRPLGRLCLDDFKINTAYMGSTFAFADTLRGRDQRRCLPGCTRADCCGDAFRKAVEMGAVQTTKSDNEVLEEYLGPDYATHMSAYGPETRKELLVKARAYDFAREHGKHRQAFERRSTPPGFWRIDMPTTQEEEQDRARATSLEREKVEERWREAIRGGRWLFRDE